jgi:transcriptional regulator GlxA family with amidase domain
LQFIKDHSSKPIQAATVARHVGLSRGMLDIRFRRAIGRSVYGEISRVRLGKATRPFFKSSYWIVAVAQKVDQSRELSTQNLPTLS